jgi:hypothetical protein
VSARLKTALALAGSFALGGGLLWLALRGVDFSGVGAAFRAAAWGWLVPLLGVALASHVLRAWRWVILLDTLAAEGRGATLGASFGATMIGYLVNYAIPRGGEVVRAANLASRSGLPFAGVLGTVVLERVLDVAVLAVALLSVAALYWDRLGVVREALAGEARAALAGLAEPPWALAVVGLVVTAVALAGLAAWVWRRRVAPREGAAPGPGRVLGALRQFRDGLTALARVRRRGALVGSTLAMWGCYALMAEIPLRMLGITAAYGLSLADAWAAMNAGAIGVAIPAPGGTGSYHYAVVQALGLLSGVPGTPAATYALLTHAAQLVLNAAAGFGSLLAQGIGLAALRRAAGGPAAGPAAGPAPDAPPVA